MKHFILLLILAITSIAHAQNFEKTFSCTKGAYEYANTAFELSDGKILVGINNTILCLAANGDSIWTKTYAGYGDIAKIFRNKQGDLLVATTLGKIIFLKINEANGDSISSFRPPAQTANSGYIIFDVVELPDGDYIMSHTLGGGGNGGTLIRFTPGSTTKKWSNDYAGKNVSPKALCLDDTTIVFAGYKGNPQTNWNFDLYIEKLSINNVSIWNKSYLNFQSSYKDRLVGLQKNNNNQYLLAANFNFRNRACASILKVNNNGDSLALSVLATYEGDTINHGYCYSLQRNGSNGYYAAGLMNINKKDPLNNTTGIGYMSILEVNENGEIIKAAAYNNIGFYQVGSTVYDGAQAWGSGAIKCKDGSYLLYGTGNRLMPSAGGYYETQYRGYVVKNTAFVTGLAPIQEIASTLLAYPNPFSSELSIESLHNIEEISVLNLQGQEVLKLRPNAAQFTLNLEALTPGIYLVRTENAYGLKYLKVLKN
ncbi:MAG: T9SS type A sorting domain-containing protein [Bacteroidia bacterium]|nr:T9SS type A sorting domain-containing protein [Bacteroidia bacterium]MCF8446125.1 T9SS type A sorting domain-containing protein [Bacteroidia bacterium]